MGWLINCMLAWWIGREGSRKRGQAKEAFREGKEEILGERKKLLPGPSESHISYILIAKSDIFGYLNLVTGTMNRQDRSFNKPEKST